MSYQTRQRSAKKKVALTQQPKTPVLQNDKDKINKKQKQHSSSSKFKLSQKVSINSENFVMCKVGQFDDDYVVEGKLGQGTFGSVYKVFHKGLKTHRALKTIKKNSNSKFSSFDEIEILKKLDHPNILKIYEFYEAKESYYIITQVFEGKQLFDEILQQDKLSEEIAADIVETILRALNYTHSLGIAHRDVKAQNILLKKGEDGNFKVKIIDWGLGTLIGTEGSNRVCGTPEYCAPQVLQGNYSLSCDMWSMGVLTYIMLTGQMPFTGKNTQQTINCVRKGVFNVNQKSFRKLSKQAQKFIISLIQKDPSKRLTAEDSLKHQWLTNCHKHKKAPQELKETLQRLRQFKVTNNFGVAVVSFVNNHLSSEKQKQKLEEIFKYLDTNGDGVLSQKQLIEGYSKIYGKAMAKKIAEQTFQKLDINQNGSLEYSQFIAFGLQRHQEGEALKLKEAFNLFDRNKDGHISMSEIKEVIVGKLQGVNGLSEEDIMQIDKNGDNQIDFNQFLNCVQNIYAKVNQKAKKNSNKLGLSPIRQKKTKN